MDKMEKIRLLQMMQFEEEHYKKGYTKIAGVDEAGRGPLAGPVVAAACILPRGCLLEGLNDSKLVTEKNRDKLFAKITSHPDIYFKIITIDTEEIERINILHASLLGMKKAVEGLDVIPDFIFIDGNKKIDSSIPMQTYTKGDSRSCSIAAASILAKFHRDALMRQYHAKWPEYGFNQNKGYATAKHKAALKKYGACPIHRRDFAPVRLALAGVV